MAEGQREWAPTAGGTTLGAAGPEGGSIDLDESLESGVRILLESDAPRGFYSVTCIIPDWMVYPRHFDAWEKAEQAYREMKEPLAELASQIPENRPPPGHPDTLKAGQKLIAFTVRFA